MLNSGRLDCHTFGGHHATLTTHIDDFVESTRVVTPVGILETRRLPGSGAGPSPDRMFIGSEGILGIITEAWVRLRRKPIFRTATSVRFKKFLCWCRCCTRHHAGWPLSGQLSAVGGARGLT